MNNQGKNVLIGVFVVAAIVLVVFLVLFLEPSVGDESYIVRVRFANVEKIQVGTRVTFAGKPVGQVIAIEEIRDARRKPSDKAGELYFWEVTLGLDSSVRVYDTDEITVYTPGFLGDRIIAIIPKRPLKGVTPRVVTDQVITADSTDQLQDTFSELVSVASRMGETFDQVSDFLKKNDEEISDAIVAFRKAMHGMDGTFSDIQQERLIARLRDALDELTGSMHEVGQFTRALEDEGFAENISEAAASIGRLGARLNQGQGTLGRLLFDDSLYLKVMGLISKADTVMSDINHYGLLFHLKRGWQRERTRRAEALRSLNSTRGYQLYFQREVTEIQTSLNRVSMLLDKARIECPNAPLLRNRQFACEFAQLLREVEELRRRLLRYNEQLSSLDS